MERANLIRVVFAIVVGAGLWGCGSADSADPVDIQATVATQVEATLAASKPNEAPPAVQQPPADVPADTPKLVATVSASPQGKIAFTTQRGKEYAADLYVMNPDGTALTRLTHEEDSVFVAPVWSPDGERIAFVDEHDNWPYWLYVIDSDGTNLTSFSVELDEIGVSWSPDGRYIAVVADDEADIFDIIDVGGGEQLRLTQTLNAMAPAIWLSNDAILGIMEQVACAGYCTSNMDGSNPSPFLSLDEIAKICDYNPEGVSWSQEQGFAFVCEVDDTLRIYLWDAESREPILLASLENIPSESDSFRYAVKLFEWSPDHKSIAVANDGQLYIVDTDSFTVRLLASDLDLIGFQTTQSWSPDSRMITFSANGDIFVIDVETGSITNLTNSESVDLLSAWSP